MITFTKRNLLISMLVFIFLQPSISSGLQNETTSINVSPQAEPPDVTFEITSEYTDKTYEIEIHLPYDYDENRTNGYPVLFFPNYVYHIVWSGNVYNAYNNLNEWTNFTMFFEQDILPRSLIVGITDTQMTETRFESDLYTNTDDFYNFFEFELIPTIESDFNTDPEERIIAGWQETSFFVMESFFRYPDTVFSKFISIDGYLDQDSRITDGEPDLVLAEADMANRLGEGADIDVDLFMCARVNDAESYYLFKDISRALFRRNYNLLNLRTEIITFENDYGNGWYTGLGIFQNYNTYPFAAYQVDNEDIYVGEEVSFTFAGSHGNRTQIEYFWDFDDGTNSFERSPTHAYTVAAEYQVNLTISDEFNNMDSYVFPGGIRVFPGFRPIDPGETSINLQNTGSYQTKSTNVDDVKFPKQMFLILPLLAVIRKRRPRK